MEQRELQREQMTSEVINTSINFHCFLIYFNCFFTPNYQSCTFPPAERLCAFFKLSNQAIFLRNFVKIKTASGIHSKCFVIDLESTLASKGFLCFAKKVMVIAGILSQLKLQQLLHYVASSFTYQYPQWQYFISGVNWQTFSVRRTGILGKQHHKELYNVLET